MSDDRTGELPVIEPGALDGRAGRAATAERDGVDGRNGPVAGVLLAAGTGVQYEDGNKLLATLAGEPVVRRAARPLVATDLDPLVAVLGHEAAAIEDALSGRGFRVVTNPAYEAGQATSVRTGVEALGDVAGAVFALGDMPLVEPASVEALVATYRAGRATALAAACDGRRGNPVLFDSAQFDALAGVSGDVGGRSVLLGADEAALVETGDLGVLRDVDTREDLERLRRDLSE
jgi:molybdenum cofactor cytidylyltransferase